VGYGSKRGDGRRSGSLPSFVPARYRDIILRASQRWNVGAALLSAQIYAESGFNPFARSPAGAQGIAQFMPGTARSYGLRNPFDPEAAINAQARLMRDHLRRFASVPLALAAYNAGPAAVSRCMCIPPYPETRAYVAKILGMLGGAGDIMGLDFEVRLVE
jgi:soluble lytic murein transglycosylase-like protein